MDDFDIMMSAAKERGLKVIMDFVPNHSSNEHDWFLRSERREDPFTDYYIWRDRNESNAGGVPNNWLSVFRGSAWEWSEVREQFYYHAFTLDQPDLNYWNTAVIQEMKDVLRSVSRYFFISVAVNTSSYFITCQVLGGEGC